MAQPKTPRNKAPTPPVDQDEVDLTRELGTNDAPEPDEPDDAGVDPEEPEEEDENEEVLVRMLHEDGVHHVNLHPLKPGTVISMKRKDFKEHQERGVLAEKVGDDYDGEVYDVTEPWKPEAA